MQNELMRLEADFTDLGQITHETALNLNRLTGIVGALADRISELADHDRILDLKLEALAGTVDRLADRIDRFIAGQSDRRHN